MGGLKRIKAQVIPPEKQRRCTCTTRGCPDAAVVILPQNDALLLPLDKTGFYERNDPTNPAYVRGPEGSQEAETRLCMRCVRAAASGLPPGMRLPGARLRYEEVTPGVAAPHEIEGTPEWAAAQRERDL